MKASVGTRACVSMLALAVALASKLVDASPAPADTMSMEHMHGHEPMHHAAQTAEPRHPMHQMHEMPAHPLGYPDGREASGTSWLPDRTPTHHLMTRAGSWTLMGHGTVFLGYDRMNGPRGDDRVFAPNMIMLMAERNAGPQTRWGLAGMFSADAVTVGGEGYPLLFQTGETWDDVPLHDHQHPHNVFSELSGSLAQGLGEGLALHLYVAPVGEPALGPPAYPHRPVADQDPLAPIGHHWQDATHISFWVGTASLQTRRLQIEGSVFNGREPGENRAEIQSPGFDSGSGRLSFNPSDALALQVSHGYLHAPEAIEPDVDVWRTTASAVWVRRMGEDQSVDLTLVWGRNHELGRDFDSWLLEGEWAREHGLTPFMRLERVEKNSEELVLPASYPAEESFALRQASLGATMSLPIRGSLSWAAGAQAMVSITPDELRGVYGDNPGGWVIFMRVRPSSAGHEAMTH